MSDVVRHIDIRARTSGMEKAKAEVLAVAKAQEGVAVTADKMTASQGRARAEISKLEASAKRLEAAKLRLATAEDRYQSLLSAGPQKAERMRATLASMASAEAAVIDAQRRHAAASSTVSRALDQQAANSNQATTATIANTAALKANAAAANMASHNARNLSFQLVDIGQALVTLPQMGIYGLQNIGFQLAQIGQIYAGQGGLNAAIRDSVQQVGKFVRAAGPLIGVAAVIGGAFAGMTYEINKTAETQVSFGNTVQAVMNVSAGAVRDLFMPVVEALSPLFSTVWNGIVSTVSTGINTIIGVNVGAYQAIKVAFSDLPNFFGALGIGAANKFMEGIDWLLVQVGVAMNSMTQKINAAFGTSLKGVGNPNKFAIGYRLENPFNEGDILGRVQGAFSEGFNRNYTGEFFDAVSTEAQRLAKAQEKVNEAGRGVRDASRSAGRAIKDAAAEGVEAYQSLRAVADDTADALQNGLDFTRDVARGFFDDFRQGLKEGEGVWKSFQNAALGALDKIADKLIDMATDNVIDGLLGSLLGSRGGGLLAAIGGGGNGLSLARGFLAGGGFGLFQSGGHTGYGSVDSIAGFVHGQEFVNNAQSTRRYRPILEVMNAGGDPSPFFANNNRQGQQHVHVTVGIDQNGNLTAHAEQVAQRVAVGVVQQGLAINNKRQSHLAERKRAIVG